ncbi:MAG TPA: hypothetical protein VH475_08760 [Tepidisphaeraceae bacterium]|jgi:hypothetical protein
MHATSTRSDAVSPLDYATPGARPRRTVHPGLVFMIALVAAFLCADPFATAVGFPVASYQTANHDPMPVLLRILTGLVIFGLVAAAAAPVTRAARGVMDVLARTQARPTVAVTLTLIICGTACLLGAMGIELYLVRHAAGSMSVSGPDVSLSIQTPLFGQILVGLTFLFGVALVAIGIWASLDRAQVPPPLPPPAP